MCLPFCCGDHGDHGSSTYHSGNQQPPRPGPTHPSPPTASIQDHEDGQPPYKPVVKPSSPVKQAHGHHAGVVAGGEVNNGGAHAVQGHVAGVNKNGERMPAAFGSSDADVHGYAAASVVRRPKMSIPAAQAPQHKEVYASPRHHGSVAASHPKEATYKMRAPPVLQMARRSGEDDYPAAATTTPTSFYGDLR
ncbi:hypothetical protein U9M48_028681 [Paspalum notatum var. saurae]|uniref:Uncharacterized protein n=1 Tax=Paspalum notatum var. saurae TaxID=547442 RepID=A0AAQ3TXA0_PASNO